MEKEEYRRVYDQHLESRYGRAYAQRIKRMRIFKIDQSLASYLASVTEQAKRNEMHVKGDAIRARIEALKASGTVRYMWQVKEIVAREYGFPNAKALDRWLQREKRQPR
jgi:hypothetical protein